VAPDLIEVRTLDSSALTAQYESLRGTALGNALPPEARSGLTLFLRRGLWGWARASAPRTAPVPPTRSASPSAIDSHDRKDIIHLFAAIALTSTNGRSNERIDQGAIAPSQA
jgi:hypothetical protein